jgi:hypothetical protein
MTLLEWNGASWSTLATSDVADEYGVVSISNAASFCLLRNSAANNWLELEITSANSYDSMNVYIRNNAPPNTTLYDTMLSGITPFSITGFCNADVYLYIENKNVIEDDELYFSFSLASCSPSTTTGSTTGSIRSTTGSRASTTGSSYQPSNSDPMEICAYCEETCQGDTVCKSYPQGVCTQINDQCTGDLIGYGIFSYGEEPQVSIYDTVDCSGEASLTYESTCGTCWPEMNAYAQCSSTNTAMTIAPTLLLSAVLSSFVL